jgi:hypothetical protein
MIGVDICDAKLVLYFDEVTGFIPRPGWRGIHDLYRAMIPVPPFKYTLMLVETATTIVGGYVGVDLVDKWYRWTTVDPEHKSFIFSLEPRVQRFAHVGSDCFSVYSSTAQYGPVQGGQVGPDGLKFGDDLDLRRFTAHRVTLEGKVIDYAGGKRRSKRLNFGVADSIVRSTDVTRIEVWSLPNEAGSWRGERDDYIGRQGCDGPEDEMPLIPGR